MAKRTRKQKERALARRPATGAGPRSQGGLAGGAGADVLPAGESRALASTPADLTTDPWAGAPEAAAPQMDDTVPAGEPWEAEPAALVDAAAADTPHSGITAGQADVALDAELVPTGRRRVERVGAAGAVSARRVERVGPPAGRRVERAGATAIPAGLTVASATALRPRVQRHQPAGFIEPLEGDDPAIPFDRVPYVPADLRRVAIIAAIMIALIVVADIIVSNVVK